MPMLVAGTIVQGRYRVLRPAGRGGMGAVFEALDTRLGCVVALKLMSGRGRQLSAAFEHEARLLASLRHPVLPVVSDYFEDEDGQFLVMQFIPGEDLARGLAKRQAPFPPADVLSWLGPLFDALEYLHSREPPVIHRDIKPANLKLTPEGTLVLLDFGLAKGSAAGSGDRIEPSIPGYTPSYAPIEQIEGAGTDARADIYALGATLYHLLTWSTPPNAVERAGAVLNGDPDPLRDPRQVVEDIPERVAVAITRAMSLRRGDRFPSVSAMRAALCGPQGAERGRESERQPAVRSRRVDAAAPAQAEVGRHVDLLVQVRFPDSPRLGREDWPSRRRPDAVEQASEEVRLAFPHDPATGEPRAARVRVKVVASDFRVEGDAERLIDVPPDAYSPRVSFLLTPLRSGTCRLNVEVYAIDAAYLGSASIDTEVGTIAEQQPEWQVSSLVLDVIAREVAGLLAQRRPATPPSLDAETTVDTLLASPSATAPRAVPPPAPTMLPPAAAVPSPQAPTGEPITQALPATARRHSPPADGELPLSPRSVRWTRMLAPAAAVVMIGTASALYVATTGHWGAPPAAPVSPPDGRQAVAAPIDQPPSARAPGVEAGAAAAPPEATPPPAAARRLGGAPRMAPAAPAAPIAVSPAPPRGRESGARQLLSASATAEIVGPGATRFRFEFANAGAENASVTIDWGASFVVDASGRRRALVDTAVAAPFVRDIPARGMLRHAVELPLVVRHGEWLTITLASADPGTGEARFRPITIRVQ